MINYFIYIVIALILIFVFIIAIKAVNLGIKAKNKNLIEKDDIVFEKKRRFNRKIGELK